FTAPRGRKPSTYRELSAGDLRQYKGGTPMPTSKIDALLGRAVDAGDVPGVVAMATDRTGVIYEGAFGKRVLGQPAAMTADTVVWIASMSKALKSAGVMQLVEQGKLDLDAAAAKIVPEIATIEVLEGFGSAAQSRTRPPTRP